MKHVVGSLGMRRQMNSWWWLLVIGLAVVIAGYGWVWYRGGGERELQIPTRVSEEEVIEVKAPPPTGEAIVTSFFRLLDEGRVEGAMEMMSREMATEAGWEEQFGLMEAVEVRQVVPIMVDEWTDEWQEYRVKVKVKMSWQSAKAPIPYYGWDDEEEVRFVPLVMEDGRWKIGGIGTGP